ncbi:hypothetical protein [Sedimentisphaera salicampi]|nr:hypothetical protein [Sedimentisphaera salicampi]
MAEPSGYTFVLKGGKDYSLPKAKLEEYQKRSKQCGRKSHTPSV